MSATPSRKGVAAAPREDHSLPALLVRLRALRERVDGDLTVEAVERQLERIQAGKASKARAGRLTQNLRDKILYELAEAEDAELIASGGGLPPLMPQLASGAPISMAPASLSSTVPLCSPPPSASTAVVDALAHLPMPSAAPTTAGACYVGNAANSSSCDSSSGVSGS